MPTRPGAREIGFAVTRDLRDRRPAWRLHRASVIPPSAVLVRWPKPVRETSNQMPCSRRLSSRVRRRTANLEFSYVDPTDLTTFRQALVQAIDSMSLLDGTHV